MEQRGQGVIRKKKPVHLPSLGSKSRMRPICNPRIIYSARAGYLVYACVEFCDLASFGRTVSFRLSYLGFKVKGGRERHAERKKNMEWEEEWSRKLLNTEREGEEEREKQETFPACALTACRRFKRLRFFRALASAIFFMDRASTPRKFFAASCISCSLTGLAEL